jgi:senataxin
MHPDISVFPSQTFYNGRLLDGPNMAGLRKRPWHSSLLLGPYRFFDVQGQHQAAPQGHSLINRAEIDVAMQLYKRLMSDFRNFNFKGKIGIITPYKSQLRELKYRFSEEYGSQIVEDIEFNTTDAFQGRESEIIIFSCVRASPAGGIGFLQDIRRMNVGLTRAKSSLWVLGNSQSLVRGQFWKKLVDDARNRQRYSEGNIMKMLQQHSKNFPAPKELLQSYEHPEKQKIKEEPMDHDSTQAPSMSSASLTMKQEVKTEILPEIKQELPNGYSSLSNGKRKAAESPSEDNDVEMTDAPSESTPTSHTGSRQSTPAGISSAGATPVPDGSKSSTPAGDPLAGMAMSKPKIKRRPKPTADPFIRRR